MKSIFALIIYVLVLALILLCSCSGSERRARQEQTGSNIRKIKFLKHTQEEIIITSFVKGTETQSLSKGDTIMVVFHNNYGFYVMADSKIAPFNGVIRIAVVQ